MAGRMKKMISSMKGRRNGEEGSGPSAGGGGGLMPPTGDRPEDNVVREVIAFCESNAPGSAAAGEEYLHLPAIVDGAESSPAAAKAAASTIQKYLGKDQYPRGFAQYNAIMLTRILTDNPGRNFTQNFDKEFVSTAKKLLRDSADASVQQIFRETLDYMEAEKLSQNETLAPLVEMWKREKGAAGRLQAPGGVITSRFAPPQSSRPPRGLPPPGELAARIEEAKTTARLLVQTIQSTPQSELLNNELVSEFGARVRAAHKSILGYMACENPRPDDDTMMTLIETNEQLNIAVNKYERSKLQARRAAGQATPSPQPPTSTEATSYVAAGQPGSHQQPQQSAFGQAAANGTRYQQSPATENGFVPPAGPPPGKAAGTAENPFSDDQAYEQPSNSYSLFASRPNKVSQQASQPPGSPTRPTAAAHGDVQPTPSYAARQASASANLTMHGASPPLQPST